MKYWAVVKKSVAGFVEDNSFTDAAAIAFYTIFSLPAMLIILLQIGATLYERSEVQKELINQVSRLIGPSSAQEIEKILLNAALDETGVIAKTVGIITLVFSATTVFMALQGSLNKTWKIKAKPERGIVKYIINRLLSLAMVISIGFILLVSLIIDALLVVLQNKFSAILPGIAVYVFTSLNIVISIAFITMVFALIYKVLPDARIKWRDVWIGSVVTTVLFTLGKYLIGFYLGNSEVGSAYGAAGSLVIILVWVYYSSAILLFGAHLTFVYAQEIGEEIRPYKNAVKVEMIELEKAS